VASATLALAMLALALTYAPAARAASVPLGGGETRVALAPGFDKALRQEGVAVKALDPVALKGRKLTLPVASGSYDPAAEVAVFLYGGGFSFAGGGKAVALRKLRLDASAGSLSATVGGKRMRLAEIGGAQLEREGFDARLKAKRLLLTATAAAALNRVFGLPRVFRAGRSLGSVDGLGEPSEVDVSFGQISIGGPETAFSRLQSLKVEMGIWGGTQRWGAGAENYFVFEVAPARVAGDASAGIVEGLERDGVTMQIFEQPPREMLLRRPRIDLATRELSATISPLSQEGALTGTIATLDYSGAQVQARPKVGAFELMGIRAISNQFIADQLNARFATPGLFQAGETLARMTVVLSAS
jgi:hypothetical protein